MVTYHKTLIILGFVIKFAIIEKYFLAGYGIKVCSKSSVNSPIYKKPRCLGWFADLYTQICK